MAEQDAINTAASGSTDALTLGVGVYFMLAEHERRLNPDFMPGIAKPAPDDMALGQGPRLASGNVQARPGRWPQKKGCSVSGQPRRDCAKGGSRPAHTLPG